MFDDINKYHQGYQSIFVLHPSFFFRNQIQVRYCHTPHLAKLNPVSHCHLRPKVFFVYVKSAPNIALRNRKKSDSKLRYVDRQLCV